MAPSSQKVPRGQAGEPGAQVPPSSSHASLQTFAAVLQKVPAAHSSLTSQGSPFWRGGPQWYFHSP
jgi:hypothetical protein